MLLPTKQLRPLLGLLVLLAAGILLGWSLHRVVQDSLRFRHESTALRIEEVQKLAELVTLRVPITDVQTASLSGYTGSISAVLLIKGDVQISFDLSQAKFAEQDPTAKSARLLLPPPRPNRPRLDHAGTRIYSLDRSGLWALYPGPAAENTVIDLAMQRAQNLLETAAAQPALLDQARGHAIETLSPFFAALGWKVSIEFQSQ